MSNFIDSRADVGSDEESEIDSETGEHIRRNGTGKTRPDVDSSEEEESDDEEAARAVREGFIVEDDDDDVEIESRQARKKRRREERERDLELDVEDLEVIGVQDGDDGQPKFKRLKQGHRDRPSALEISDDEAEPEEVMGVDEFDGFIEEDEFSDDDREKIREEREVGRPGRKPFSVAGLRSGLDERALEDYELAFGDNTEYEWALALEERAEEEDREEKPLELKDIFEPAQLAAKLLTDEDMIIRDLDVPERLQLAWKSTKLVERSPEETARLLDEEAQWIARLLLPKKRLEEFLHDPFESAISEVLKFFNNDKFEVPFIWQQRRDFIIHEYPPNADGSTPQPERLLAQTDLWEIFELDLRFKALVEKREALASSYEELKSHANISDSLIDSLLPKASSAEEVQDLQDYLHFQYSAQLKDVAAMTSTSNGVSKRPLGGTVNWEAIRSGPAYSFVRAVGMTADDFARNAIGVDTRVYAEDATERPDDLADSLISGRYNTGAGLLSHAKIMFVEELATNPRMRQYMRKSFYENCVVDCQRTEKGAIEITDDHRYYEFKYLKNIEFSSLARKPESFLRMIRAEQEGLIEIQFRILNSGRFRQRLYAHIESDSVSEIAEHWNRLRQEWIDSALDKLERIISRGVKEALKTECENTLARACRDKYSEKLDVAPYKPKDLELGSEPSVLALSNGQGVPGRDAVVYVFVDELGHMIEHGKFDEIRSAKDVDKFIPQGADNGRLLDIIDKRRPDVIAISGFTPETRKLQKEIDEILDKHKEEEDAKMRNGNADSDDDADKFVKPEVVMVNDEVARLYYNTERAQLQFPQLTSIGRYCVALARYLRSPLLEYASIGADISSIKFDPNQDLVPPEKLTKHLEYAMVDMVNLVGVNLEEALDNPYVANLLPYVCGLGPRKAARVLEVIGQNGGVVQSRQELVGDLESNLAQAMGPVVYYNAASFVYLTYQPDEKDSDPLDNTRIHPEDYDIAKKIAADALNLDEEDIAYERRNGGPSAEVRRLIANHEEDALQDLHLENYADELEQKLNQKKRATLETIRAELVNRYEELRREFVPMQPDDIFTMLTGETKETLADSMIVPVKIKRIHRDHIEVRLDCGVDGIVSDNAYSVNVTSDLHVKDYYNRDQILPAKLLFINRKTMAAQLSFNEEMLKRPYQKAQSDKLVGQWDKNEEERDARQQLKEKESKAGRPHRVIKHPLFRPFNTQQAVEYLGSKNPGDVVIRPSSRGIDHLAITWKVADNVFKHFDVLELDKESEYALGKILRIEGKYNYVDLDDLIVNHVEAMAKKVNEMTNDARFQKGSRNQTEQWLATYTEANPRRSMYAFCINKQYPGYFDLCFKEGQGAPPQAWPVQVVPNGFMMNNNSYPNMEALKNGFKLLMITKANKANNAQQHRR